LISIAETIAVPCPPKRLWDVVSSPADVVSCIAGAELGAAHEDGSFDGTLAVRFGGLRVKFAARINLELEESELVGRLSARGGDGQAATRFTAGATFRVEQGEGPQDARVSMDGEIRLTGKLASLVESGAGIVVSRMTKEFTVRLIERCAADQPPQAAELPAAAPAAVSADVATTVTATVTAPATTRSPAPAGPTGPFARVRAWWRRLRNRGPVSGDGADRRDSTNGEGAHS
jgi:carbon monoxide dehydrogenase subunit G